MHDLFDGIPKFMLAADLVYCDPPWNAGNLNAFYTKAEIAVVKGFPAFVCALFEGLRTIGAPVCYLEIGKQNLALFEQMMGDLCALYRHVQVWPITYYRKHRAYLLRGAHDSTTDTDFTSLDDMHTPRVAMEAEKFECVADLCMGRGLTGLTAYRLGKRFVGTELNKRRLAVLLEAITHEGGMWTKGALQT